MARRRSSSSPPTFRSRLPERRRRERNPPLAPVKTVAWATYGFDDRRARFAPNVGLRPPFRRVWTFRGRALLEFPPAVAYGRIYLPTFDGRFYALDARTGKTIWSHRTRRCGWASPAVWRRLVYVTFIGRRATCGDSVPGRDGIVVAYDADSGKIVWQRTTGPNESSPLVSRGLVYVGDWDGRIWALDARTGRTRWTFRTRGRIKGSPALSGNRVFVGDYDGHLYALDARTGRLAWRASAQPRLGGRGAFYSTPAAAYGRVFIGNTDGKVYAFGATSGRLLWSQSTGGYVYASPAVWRRLILVGSYDHSFYALDAATGDVRWRFRANGPISGSASVIVRRRLLRHVRRADVRARRRRRAASSGVGRTGSTHRSWPTGSGSISSVSGGCTEWSSGAEVHAAASRRQRFSTMREMSGHSAEPPKFITPAANTFAPRAVS